MKEQQYLTPIITLIGTTLTGISAFAYNRLNSLEKKRQKLDDLRIDLMVYHGKKLASGLEKMKERNDKIIKASSKQEKGGLERLNLLYEIISDMEQYEGRNRIFSETAFNNIKAKVDKLTELRKTAGKNYPHPTAWKEYAKAAMLAGKPFDEVERLFNETLTYIKIADESQGPAKGLLINKIDALRVKCDIVRLYVLKEKYDEAFRLAQNIYDEAESIDTIQEIDTINNNGAIPDDFISIKMLSGFVAMDAAIYHPNWMLHSQNSPKKIFSDFMIKLKVKYNLPMDWHYLIKLIICTDDIWLKNSPKDAKACTKDLYRMLKEESSFWEKIKSEIDILLGLFGGYDELAKSVIDPRVLNRAFVIIAIFLAVDISLPINASAEVVTHMQNHLQFKKIAKQYPNIYNYASSNEIVTEESSYLIIKELEDASEKIDSDKKLINHLQKDILNPHEDLKLLALIGATGSIIDA